jgi:predicted nucleotidyltransferase
VGGVAATLYGSRFATDDVDVLVRAEAQNLERLATFLETAGAQDRRKRNLQKVVDDLERGGTARLETRYGGFDILAEVPAEGDYSFDALLARAETVRLGRVRVKVAALDDLIAMKVAAHRVKDLARLPELRRISELRRK